MRYGQIVLGPAGAGKSTYCATMQKHGEVTNRVINVVNLDPAAEIFNYKVCADIRDLVQIDDVMEADDLNFGPNGGLIFCMEYLTEPDGLEWLQEKLGDDDEDYVIFDCPGQIELYTHMDVMNRVVDLLQKLNFRLVSIFILDSQYMVDGGKFLSGTLAALSAMMKIELPHLNILSKIDLLNSQSKKQLESFLEPEVHELLSSDHNMSRFNKKFNKLTQALGKVVEEYSLVKFVPLNTDDESSIGDVLLQIDFALQYGEDADVKVQDYDYQDQDNDDDDDGEDMFAKFG